TTVLSVLSETTVPVSTRFGMAGCSLLRGRGGASHLGGLDAGDRAADLTNAAGLFELAGGGLEAQIELLALQIGKLGGELIVRRHLDVILLGAVLLRHD